MTVLYAAPMPPGQSVVSLYACPQEPSLPWVIPAPDPFAPPPFVPRKAPDPVTVVLPDYPTTPAALNLSAVEALLVDFADAAMKRAPTGELLLKFAATLEAVRALGGSK